VTSSDDTAVDPSIAPAPAIDFHFNFFLFLRALGSIDSKMGSRRRRRKSLRREMTATIS
jgi:hypothetical protein